MKNGVRVLIAYFEYEDSKNKSFCSERLINAANHSININSLENDRDFKAEFKTVFRQPSDNKKQSDKIPKLRTMAIKYRASLRLEMGKKCIFLEANMQLFNNLKPPSITIMSM